MKIRGVIYQTYICPSAELLPLLGTDERVTTVGFYVTKEVNFFTLWRIKASPDTVALSVEWFERSPMIQDRKKAIRRANYACGALKSHYSKLGVIK